MNYFFESNEQMYRVEGGREERERESEMDTAASSIRYKTKGRRKYIQYLTQQSNETPTFA